MRRLTKKDSAAIIGSSIKGLHVEVARVKR